MYDEVVVPDAELMESMRAIGYSLKTAIADLCDNSIAANAKNVRLVWEINNLPSVRLLDDGDGMSRETLRQAMKLAGKSPLADRAVDDLGRFGLGLKTASLSQARCLTVVSKRDGEYIGARWDLDHLREVGGWNLTWLETEEIASNLGFEGLACQKSGTLVEWTKLDQLMDSDAFDQIAIAADFEEVAAHLGLVFHRFTSAKSAAVKITVNGKSVPNFDPFLEGESGVVDREATTVTVGGEPVTVHPFILPALSQMTRAQKDKALFDANRMREAQGFYIYRNKRLLYWGTWFRIVPMDESGRLARVRVDTGNALDVHWKLGIMKSTVQPPKPLLEALKRLVPNIIENSTRAVTRRSAVQTNVEGRVWNIKEVGEGAFALEVNPQHPMLMDLFERLAPSEQQILNSYVDALARYIPAEELHGLLARDRTIREGFQTDEEIWQFAETLFTQMLRASGGDEGRAWAAVETIEPFANDTQLKSRLRALRNGVKQ